MSNQERGYRPLKDYAVIGDAHTAALIASDGSIDWCCWPRFDSGAVFCRLLDARKGGWCRVGPTGQFAASRRYVDKTNILATTFITDSGRLRVTDFMPVWRPPSENQREDLGSASRILRLVEGVAGTVEIEVCFWPTFEYARASTIITPCAGGAVARAGQTALAFTCPLALQFDVSGVLRGRARVEAGHRLWIILTFGAEVSPADPSREADAALAHTREYWRRWSASCTYEGPYHDWVRRSALTLKLLTFASTGAVVAAPTTSLPEAVGGSRNWDYRYTWLRDSALIMDALMRIGYHQEAIAFSDWLETLSAQHHGDMQIMYAVDGNSALPESTLAHLEGYRHSRPVRIGNAAAHQTQLDIYGEVLDAIHRCYTLKPRPMRLELWTMLQSFAEHVATRWREPGQGIWEVREAPQHFLYSKLMCWVALDRAIQLAEGRPELSSSHEDRWRQVREEIRQAILTEGYDTELGAFTQTLGTPALDASALAIPLVGFLPPTDPRVRSTVARIQERLTSHGLVYRYRTDDGLFGEEATFALCSFWLVDNLALGGHVEEARRVFERVISFASDLGLLAEEIEPTSGELLGNYPQGFTHLALIRSALTIAEAEGQGQRKSAP